MKPFIKDCTPRAGRKKQEYKEQRESEQGNMEFNEITRDAINGKIIQTASTAPEREKYTRF